MITRSFTLDKIKKAAQKLKKNEATGRDNVHAEFIKHGSEELLIKPPSKSSETGTI